MTISEIICRVVAGFVGAFVGIGCIAGVEEAGHEGNPWKAVVLCLVTLVCAGVVVAALTR